MFIIYFKAGCSGNAKVYLIYKYFKLLGLDLALFFRIDTFTFFA